MKNKTDKRKSSSLKKNYIESWNYVKDSRNFIYITIAVFLFFFLVGFFVQSPKILEEKILEFIRDLLLKTEGMSPFQLISFIFFNNLKSSFIGMLFGIIFGIFPVVTSLTNGYLLGFVAEKTVAEEGVVVLWRLFPHGIFELPALFISLGLGIKLGTFIFKRNKLETLGAYISKSIKAFFFIVIPLLIIAAVIEGVLISLF